MKKLEELGISPAPWKCVCYKYKHDHLGEIRLKSNQILCLDLSRQDAKLAAAAPEMYEALRKITEEQECGRDCAKCTNHGCVIKECKAALAKASGEGEVAK